MARDRLTLDLFRDYAPEPVVARFNDDEVRAFTLAGRLSKAVGLTLDEAAPSRAEVAKAIGAYLDDELSKSMLDKYAASGSEHSISAIRLAALVAVTGDARALNTLLAEIGLIAVPKKYEALLRRERARELAERAEREALAADAEWRAGR